MEAAGIYKKLKESVASCKIALIAVGICAAGFASGAQFHPTTGGNLEDAANWNSAYDNTSAITKAQSAALSISAANATLPN